jgi:calcineurin-like phosphoesterase family protein
MVSWLVSWLRRRVWLSAGFVVLAASFAVLAGGRANGWVTGSRAPLPKPQVSSGTGQNQESVAGSVDGASVEEGDGGAVDSAARPVRLPTGGFVPSQRRSGAIVWAVGDGADGGDAAKSLVQRIASERVDRLLYLGDVYESGLPSDFFQNYAPVYGQLAHETAPTPGNHEWPSHVKGYDRYWKRIHGQVPPAFYSFAVGGWQILSLNSEAPHDPRSPQVRWLRSQLRKAGTCRLAFWHRPRYSAGTHHGDQFDVQPFWDALRGHAAIVINGHEHDMQRMRRRDGITEFVSGAGGRSHYGLDRSYPGLAFGNDVDWGGLRLQLRPRFVRFAFITSRGLTLDSGAVSCRPLDAEGGYGTSTAASS